MATVFTRWPSKAARSRSTKDTGQGLPGWMLAPVRSRWPERTWALVTAAGLVLVPAALVCAASSSAVALAPLRPGLVLLAAVGVSVALVRTAQLLRALSRSEARHRAIFERAGISMWLEDWSAAAEAVASLRRSGISDMEAYYATRPDELRALCSRVIIKDVNLFTLEESGVANKGDVIGPLDRLLPHTDQTFVQWLTAFSQGERFFRSEAHITRPDGSISDTLFTAALPSDVAGFSNIMTTSLDITDYRNEQARLLGVEAEIARASRVSTVGALGASIAHEVNSPLAAVIANAQAALRWLRREAPEVGEATEAVAAIVAEATRAKDIVARTRAFISNVATPAAPFDLVAAAREANLLVERELRSLGAAVHLRVEPNLPLVHGDLVQIQQVFTNLLLNAAQAMAGQATAREIVAIFTREGGGVRVDISDTGPGIDPAKLERVFDPLFTTKPDGMGMGLAICRSCVDAQGGNIWASSRPEGGATFHFTLPAFDG